MQVVPDTVTILRTVRQLSHNYPTEEMYPCNPV